MIRGNVDSLMKLVAALDNAGIELISPGSTSVTGRRGVRLKEHLANPTIVRGDNQNRRHLREGQWPRLGECRTFTKLRSYKDADLIAGFIVVGAALVTQIKYQPPFRVHALLRVTTRRSVSLLTGSISRFAKPAAGRPPSVSPR